MSGEKRQFIKAKKKPRGRLSKPRHKDFSHGLHKGLTPGPQGHGSKLHLLEPQQWKDCSLCGTSFQAAFQTQANKPAYCPECIESFKNYRRR